MEFIPAELTTENRGENQVWRLLQEAYSDVDGFAYHRFPIYLPSGYYGYEADVVLVTRDAGVIVVECKGYHIENLGRIEGHQWHLENWTRDIEHPVRQARDQMFALKNWLRTDTHSVDDLRFHHVVALPFVKRAEWRSAAFHLSPVDGAVKLMEDLTPQQLREWYGALKQRNAQVLSEAQWSGLKQQIGRPSEQTPIAMTQESKGPKLYCYEERVPEPEEIRRLLPGRASCTFVTATTAVEARRFKQGFGGSHQVGELPEGGPEPNLTFPKFLRHIIPTPLFTRAEERVLLWRAALTVAEDQAKARRLKHDVFAWRDAIAWLDENGYDFSRDTVPDDVITSIVHPEVKELLADLQRQYRVQQQKSDPNKAVFENAARSFLETTYRPTEYVILEGFSHFTPLQRLFIERCTDLGAQVILLFPYRGSQKPAFVQVAREFQTFAKTVDGRAVNLAWIGSPRFDESHRDLNHVKTHLFASTGVPLDTEARDRSVTVHGYEHINTEVATVVEEAIQYIDNGYPPRDLAIVTSNTREYIPLLLEEAERQGAAELFQVPPRKLLLTPPGRFVLTLYKIWDVDNSMLSMAPEQFETLMASGWLSARVQKTAGKFELVKAQIFARCQTKDEWEDALDQLKRLCTGTASHDRIPSGAIKLETVERWRGAIEQVQHICRGLFDGTAYTISAHVERLQSHLTEISEQKTFSSERRVIQAIKAELEALTEGESIPMETSEFGDILNSLLRQRQDGEEVEEEDDSRISVRSLPGLDRASKRIVFMVGMDSDNMPGAPGMTQWPIYQFDRRRHYDEQRYLFLASVRATLDRLHISYSKVKEARKKQPSAFLRQVAELLGSDVDASVEAEDILEDQSQQSSQPPAKARRDVYTLDELAHFKLCPHRYKMERLSDEARRYETMWQLRFLAQGYWIAKVLLQAKESTTPIAKERVVESLTAFIWEVQAEVQARFPGLRALDWHTVEYRVLQTIRSQGEHIAERVSATTEVSVPTDITNEEGTFKEAVILDDRVVEVEVTPPHTFVADGGYRYSFLDADLYAEWLLPAGEPRNRSDDSDIWDTVTRTKAFDIYQRSIDGIDVFGASYDAIQWWSWAKGTVFYYRDTRDRNTKKTRDSEVKYSQLFGDESSPGGHIGQIISDLERGHYPKNPGSHCNLCPLNSECLGVDP
jgi:hypothetical protein